ncbi:unnamed protein product [Durusdinium trenchii]
MDEKELKELIKGLDAESAMKLGKAMDAAGTRGKEMKNAVWLWGEEEVKKFLEASEIKSKTPEKLDGKMLLMQEGDWEKEEDKEKAWKCLLPVGLKFAQDQCEADPPYIPPAAVKKRACWLWDEATVEELCGEIFCDDYYVKETEDEPDKKDVEPVKCDGKTLITKARNDLPDDFAKKAMEEALGRTTLLLMQDILMA